MKNLKIKLGLFSLLAILAASVFLISCEQEVIEEATIEQSILQNSIIFTLPEEFNKMSDEEIRDFLAKISYEELQELRTVLSDNEIELRGSCVIIECYDTSYLGHDMIIKKVERCCHPPSGVCYYDETTGVMGKCPG